MPACQRGKQEGSSRASFSPVRRALFRAVYGVLLLLVFLGGAWFGFRKSIVGHSVEVPARLTMRRPTGGMTEVLLVERLEADVWEGLARPSSHWVKTSPHAMGIAADGAEAIAQARRPPGQIATLILPADTAWNEGSGPVAVPPPAKPKAPSPDAVEAAARVLRSGEPSLILVAGRALRECVGVRLGLLRGRRLLRLGL